MSLYTQKKQKSPSERKSFINSDPYRYTIFSGMYQTSSTSKTFSEHIYEKIAIFYFFIWIIIE